MFYVYVLKSQTKEWLYVGFSDNLKRRLQEHQKGLSKATKPYRPFELIFYEAYKSKADAKRREVYLKTTKGKRSLKLILQESLL
jgi:putative endonuclease